MIDSEGYVSPPLSDEELDPNMTGGGGPPAPQGNHTNCFLDDAGSPLESIRGEREEAEIGLSARQVPAADNEQRLVQYLCEAALKRLGEPAAHLHVARTEHTRVLGSTVPKELGGRGEIPKTQFKLQVSEIFFGGLAPEIDLGTTVEEAVAATARAFGKALDELAARVPQQPRPDAGGETLGGFQGPPLDWRQPKYLTFEEYLKLTRLAGSLLGQGDEADGRRRVLEMLLMALRSNGLVTDAEPPALNIALGQVWETNRGSHVRIDTSWVDGRWRVTTISSPTNQDLCHPATWDVNARGGVHHDSHGRSSRHERPESRSRKSNQLEEAGRCPSERADHRGWPAMEDGQRHHCQDRESTSSSLRVGRFRSGAEYDRCFS